MKIVGKLGLAPLLVLSLSLYVWSLTGVASSDQSPNAPSVQVVVKGETLDLTHPATPEWLNCRFGYRYSGGPKTGACMPRALLVRQGDTVGGIAERLGHYSRWRELCYYPNPRRVGYRHAQVRAPGEFDVRHIYPGDHVGGCA